MLYYKKGYKWQKVDMQRHKLYSVSDIKRFIAMFPSMEFCFKR